MREKIDQWQSRIGGVCYEVTIVEGNTEFVGSWHCPACDLNQTNPKPATTRGEAAKWVNAETLAHHAKHHAETPPG